jgi:predicted phosphate transport protein (TIGR00153 family)
MKVSIFSSFPLFGSGKEKKTLIRIADHVKVSLEAVEGLDSALLEFSKGGSRFEERVRYVDGLEKAGDVLRREIEEDLYSGAFLPISRSRVLDFAENVDKISDAAEDASKLLSFLKKDEVSEDLLVLLRAGVAKAADSVRLLKEAVESIEDLDKVRSLIKEVRRREHESDEIAHNSFAVLYGHDHGERVLFLLAKLIDSISSISDVSEDASDSLSLIVLMHKL